MRGWSPLPAVGALAALLVLGSLAGCGPPRTLSRTHRPRPSPSIDQRLTLAARTFMSQLQSLDPAAQWGELAPQAQALWPSESARDAFLAAKFQGTAAIASFQVGQPTPAGIWASREDPAVQVDGGYRVPVSVQFSHPGDLQPGGVAAFYAKLALVLLPEGAATPLVLDEGPASLDAPLLVPAHRRPESAEVPVLMYHLVGPVPVRSQWNSSYAYSLEYGLTVTTAQFQAQMAYLAGAGAHAISLTRLADFLEYGLPLPAKPVVVTFDDGRESPYQNAVPVLTRYGFTATFFVPTGLVGKFVKTRTGTNPQHYLTWAQILQLSQTGFWIEDHTLNDNVSLWGLSATLLQRLAGQTAGALESRTGRAVQFIAYSGLWPFPTAAQAGASQRAMFSELGGMGYVGGAVDARVDSATQTTAGIWQIPRVRMNPNEPASALAQWVG